MTRRRGLAAAIAMILALAAALAFRLPNLGNRPFHGDEAVHAFKFRDIWEHGVYRYDPNEYHGPTLYYAALPIVKLKGRHNFADTEEADYRLATALAGAAIIPLLWLFRDALGRRAAVLAALLFALSPAFVFYSRYYIQEVFLVLFSLAALGCWWRYSRSGALAWLLAAAASVGLMIATKETAVLTFVATGIAWIALRRQWPGPGSKRLSVAFWTRAVVFIAVAIAAAWLFLSGLFSNPFGPMSYLESYLPWVQRAHATAIHNHPWSYYLATLLWTHRVKGPVWSEALIVGLALVGIAAAFLRRSGEDDSENLGFVRFIALATLLLTMIYCAIPYKTPWLILTPLAGMILLAGCGADWILQALRPAPLKVVGALLLLAGAGHLGWLAYETSFVYPTGAGNPYAYAQPATDSTKIQNRADALAAFAPDGYRTPIKVIWTDGYYWPIPWYLRRFSRVAYYTTVPPDPSAPIVVVDADLDDAVRPKLDPTHNMPGYIGLRPGALAAMYVRSDIWAKYVQSGRAE